MESLVQYYKNPNGQVMALVIKSDYSKPGITFFTDNGSLQQVAFMQHSQGHVIAPHFHNAINRNIAYTCETLVIRKGVLEVTLYHNQMPLHCFSIGSGDILSLFSGGHGFKIISDVEMVEIKQGPYLGEKDKTRF